MNYPDGTFLWHYERFCRLWEEVNNIRKRMQTMDEFNIYVKARNKAKRYFKDLNR